MQSLWVICSHQFCILSIGSSCTLAYLKVDKKAHKCDEFTNVGMFFLTDRSLWSTGLGEVFGAGRSKCRELSHFCMSNAPDGAFVVLNDAVYFRVWTTNQKRCVTSSRTSSMLTWWKVRFTCWNARCSILAKYDLTHLDCPGIHISIGKLNRPVTSAVTISHSSIQDRHSAKPNQRVRGRLWPGRASSECCSFHSSSSGGSRWRPDPSSSVSWFCTSCKVSSHLSRFILVNALVTTFERTFWNKKTTKTKSKLAWYSHKSSTWLWTKLSIFAVGQWSRHSCTSQ